MPPSEAALRALSILRALGRSSTAKYEAMANWIGEDDRVRGGLLFHGASTGRWSGQGVQPHNFPKGRIKNQELAWDALKTHDTSVIAQLQDSKGQPFDGPMDVLSSALRGVIIPREGYDLAVADYASIEARVLLWLAGESEALHIFRTGGDIYLDMASEIYGYECNKRDHAKERGLGKQAVLGCFTGDTEVLTQRGWLPIVHVSIYDKVWDGNEWVTHSGVVYQGKQQIIRSRGIGVTPAHMLMTPGGWVPASLVLQGNDRYRQLASEWALSQLPATKLEPVAVSSLSTSRANAELQQQSTSQIFAEEPLLSAMPVQNSRLLGSEVQNEATQPFAQTWRIEADYWTGYPLAICDAITLGPLRIRTTVAEAFASIGLIRQQAVECFLHIWFHCLDGIIRVWKSIESTMTGIMHRIISGSQLEATNSTTSAAVFDILKSGPQHRFFVRAPGSSEVYCAHNCGYGMGATKFQATCAAAGIPIEDDLAERVIHAYRSKYWRVKRLWYETEDCACGEVTAPCPNATGNIVWHKEGRFLYVTLPSGRRLAYPDPEVRLRSTPWGDMKPSLTFMGVDPHTHQWKRQTTYGGMLVENLVQAIARDIMADALMRCEQGGKYIPILTIHDEILAEVKSGTGNAQDFERLLADIPQWAEGCPIAAEAAIRHRYAKG